jgi:glycosyltransferase 2 family protein
MRLVLNISIVVGCLAFLFFNLDIHEMISIFSTYPFHKILLLCIWFLLSFVFLGFRLHAFQPDHLTPSVCMKASFIGQCANSILPARIGEGAKGLYLAKNSKMSATGIVTAILWERFSDFNMLFLLMLMAVGLTLPAHFFWASFMVLSLVWGLLFWVLIRRSKDQHWPRCIKKKWLRDFIGGLSAGISVSVLLRVIVLSILVWGQFLLETILVLKWIGGQNLTVSALLNIFILSTIALSIPFTPGSLGTFDAAFVFSLKMYGVDPNNAMALAILLRTIQYMPVVFAAIILALAGGKNFRNLLRPAFSQKCN